MSIKKIAILGSTGSIGINTLKVVERFPDKFKVVALTAYNNFELLAKQIRIFKPKVVAVRSRGIDFLQRQKSFKFVSILQVGDGLNEIVERKDVDLVVLAIRGGAALSPFLAAVRRGKTVAPANKEALVIAGQILMGEAKKHQAQVIPIDSEQSAIFQCLNGHNRQELKKIYLTASGGPLLDIPKKRFERMTVQEILKHPRWKMGKKITVDSATLMNKGFEVIEAQNLFQLQIQEIEVLIHPEAIIHSMVEFKDGSILAQLGVTDMRLPIQYALTYPNRWESGLERMDFLKLGQLTFRQPDLVKFPALSLCFEVARRGQTVPAVLNAADEEAVELFLSGKLNFSQIFVVIEKVVSRHKAIPNPKLSDIIQADRWARQEVRRWMASIS